VNEHKLVNSDADEHLTSRITEGKRNKNRKRRRDKQKDKNYNWL